ncbi:MAG: T9SS type A sorting domain-containing protein [Bacteroidota bacterium]
MQRLNLIFLLIICYIPCHSQVFSWAKTFGGKEYDRARRVHLDEQDNIYAVGRFSDSINFDQTSTSSDAVLLSNGRSDAFVYKLDKDGNHLWSTNIGGNASDRASQILLDKEKNILIGGDFREDVDFDPGPNTFLLRNDFISDQFVLKLDPDGNFLWVNHLINGVLIDMILDDQGNIYATGQFQQELIYEIDNEVKSTMAIGLIDSYIQKIDADGNTLWVKTFGGLDVDAGTSLAINADNDIYCAGTFSEEADFDPSANSFLLQSEGEYDIFILKIDSDGNFIWATSIGTPQYELSPIVETIQGDHICVSGSSDGKLFVHQYDGLGQKIWERNISGSRTLDFIRSNSMLINDNNDIYLTGTFIGNIDFDPSNQSLILSSNTTIDGESDCFVARYNKEGELTWIEHISGKGAEEGNSLAQNSNGDLLLIGNYDDEVIINSNSFSFSSPSIGASDIFITKIDQLQTTSTNGPANVEVKLMPNPSNTGVFQIERQSKMSPHAKVFVADLSGRIVAQYKLDEIDNILNLDFLADGIYCVQFSLYDKIYASKKIVIVRN